MPAARRRMVISLSRMEATRFGDFACFAAVSKRAANAWSAASVAASCVDRPYSAMSRALLASGSSGMALRICFCHSAPTTSAGRSGSGK